MSEKEPRKGEYGIKAAGKPVPQSDPRQEDDDPSPPATKKREKSTQPKKERSAFVSVLVGAVIGGLVSLCCGVIIFGVVYQTGMIIIVGLDKKIPGRDGVAKKKDNEAGLVLTPEITMNAKEFAQAFLDDEDVASRKFEGKIMEISGELCREDMHIVRLGTDEKLSIVLDGVKGSRLTVPIQPADHAKVYRLGWGTKVKVIAPFQRQNGNNSLFETGILVESERVKILELPSDELVKEVRKDFKAFTERNKNRVLMVTGAVSETGSFQGNITLKMRGEENLPLIVKMTSQEHGRFQKLKQPMIRADHINLDAISGSVSLERVITVEK